MTDPWPAAPTFTDLFTVIAPELAHHDAYCSRFYWDWEKNVAQPALEALGYVEVRWFDGERDSFGPLTRYAVATLNGVRHRLVYG